MRHKFGRMVKNSGSLAGIIFQQPTRLHGLLKGGAELGITVVEQMLPGSLEATLRYG
ncbi:MAG: hypothetical protein KC588_15985 [Nitrospira sp.]|nr:hypothetical protein [Nitrospira sp.]